MRPVLCSVLCCFVLLAAYARSEGEKAMQADAFVNGVGVNVHLHFTDTSYNNFAAVEKALKDLGVRHVRDGLVDTNWTPYYERLNALGRSGIKAILITSPNQSAALLRGYPARVPESFEGYEAPNEFDANGGANWAATLSVFLPRLQEEVKSDAATAKFAIIGPSLTQAGSFPKVAAEHASFDYANLHNYFAGRNPGTRGWGADGYGSYEWNLNLAARAWPGKPVFSTETGYFNDLNKQDGVPESVSGKYLPRLLFEQAKHGIQRTYIYELVDLGNPKKFGDATYGLLHSDFSPKPAYRAVKSVLRLLSDPGPAFAAGNLEYTLSGDLANVEHLLLQKRDGTFYLALWIEEPGYDVNRHEELAVPGRGIVFKSTEPLKITLHRLQEDGEMQSSYLGKSEEKTVEIGDRAVILELSR